MDKNILQLREYHINRGKNKSSAPIYPITKAECIIGDIGGGVTKVNALPETGEAGKIYYNTSGGTYYVYNNDKFEPIAKQGMPKGTPEITGHYVISGTDKNGASITLQPNTYYNLSDAIWFTDKGLANPDIGGLTFTFNGLDGTDDVVNSYLFRLRIISDRPLPNLVFTGVFIPAVTKKVLDNLELNHEYEFNVFDRYMLVTDVTITKKGGKDGK